MSVLGSSRQIGNIVTNIESHRLKQASQSLWSLIDVIPKQLWRTVVRSVHGPRTMQIEKRMQNILCKLKATAMLCH